MNATNNMNPTLVPSSFAQVRAIQEDVIRRWHEGESDFGNWEETLDLIPSTEAAGWAATCELLQLINTFQWHEEDKSRAHGAGDAVLGAIKRSIDASNRRRVQTVDKLDDIIFSGLKQSGQLNPTAPLNSESPGSMIDRLSVLALKLFHVTEARDDLLRQTGSESEAHALQQPLDTLQEQIQDLGQCLDDLLGGIAAGKVRVKFYRQVKLYIDPTTGKMKSDL